MITSSHLHLRPHAPAAKALLAQLAGAAGALVLARNGWLTGLWPLVGAQAGLAAAVAFGMGSARWWLPIHLGFLPLAVVALQLGIAPAWYLAAFVLLLLVYWTSFRTQVPLYLSNRPTAAAVAGLLPARPLRLLDVGAGTGSLLRPLARARPESRFTGVELAPAPWLIGRVLCAPLSNIDWRRADLSLPRGQTTMQCMPSSPRCRCRPCGPRPLPKCSRAAC